MFVPIDKKKTERTKIDLEDELVMGEQHLLVATDLEEELKDLVVEVGSPEGIEEIFSLYKHRKNARDAEQKRRQREERIPRGKRPYHQLKQKAQMLAKHIWVRHNILANDLVWVCHIQREFSGISRVTLRKWFLEVAPDHIKGRGRRGSDWRTYYPPCTKHCPDCNPPNRYLP